MCVPFKTVANRNAFDSYRLLQKSNRIKSKTSILKKSQYKNLVERISNGIKKCIGSKFLGCQLNGKTKLIEPILGGTSN